MEEHKQTVTISLEQFNHMCAKLDELREYKKNSINMIEKIRAEIEALTNANPSYTHTCDVVDRDDVLDIIDKYIEGHWIEERNDYGEITHWHCSNCYDDSGFITTCKWDYCPNCGADMRGDSDEVDN